MKKRLNVYDEGQDIKTADVVIPTYCILLKQNKYNIHDICHIYTNIVFILNVKLLRQWFHPWGCGPKWGGLKCYILNND